MAECTARDIPSLLKQLRSNGYQIVGLEQTSDSRTLGNYEIENEEFTEKTAILLGAEKTGIPVKLLSELDYSYEIPQAGLTRSLNVHVSAAVFIWEYVRLKLKN